jgi:hypothetical protein
MKSDEINEGDYCIVAQAVPGPQRDGYIAAVLVTRSQPGNVAGVAWRDDCLAGGKRWPSPVAARRFAAALAQEMIRQEPHRLAC